MKTSTKIVAGTAVVGAGTVVAWLIFRKKPVTETPVEEQRATAPAETPAEPSVAPAETPPLAETPAGECPPGEVRFKTGTGYACAPPCPPGQVGFIIGGQRICEPGSMAGALRGASVSLGHITMGPMGQSKEIPDYRGAIPRPWLNPLNRRG